MKILSLKLKNFRSWEDYRLDFNAVTILIGPNGVGKTNIIESLYLLSSGRSWRTRQESDLILWDKDYGRVTIEIEGKDEKHQMELFLQRSTDRTCPKQLKISGVKKRLLDLLGVMPSVIFSPETMQMIDGAPSLRRKFLDVLLSQTNRQYAVNLLEYQKIIRERNKLLFLIKIHKAKPDEMEFWDEKLVELGGKIIKKRLDAIKFFNKNLSDIYTEIAGKKENLKIKYFPSVEVDKFEDIIVVSFDREVEQSSTLFGPHRDDFKLFLDERDISSFGSRGEYRSAVLSLKIMELQYLEDILHEKPVLLLDDIFSELDFDRRMHLAKIVSNQQTIITTTDLDHIEKGLREKAKIVEI